MFSLQISSAQTIHWDGGGDGRSWHDPLNWSTDAVPGPTNDVVISAPGTNFTVAVNGNVTIQSLQCGQSLTVSNGALTVTAGESAITGSLLVRLDQTLRARGSNAVFTASGPNRASTSSKDAPPSRMPGKFSAR